jgi:NAD(P)-dependent dehydrogenase (short-subunit alcohol dehydrogenase family)
MESLAVALSPKIQCNAICPASFLPAEEGQTATISGARGDRHRDDAIITKGITIHRGTPEEVAELVVYLSGCSGYVNGAVIPIDGGKHVI